MLKRILIIIIPLITLLIALVNGNYLVWRLLMLMVFLIGLARLWIFLQKRGLRGNLKKPGQRLQAGKSFDIEAVVQNESRLPKPFLKVRITAPLAMLNNEVSINLPTRGTYYWHSQVTYPLRGRYRIGPLSAELNDPFNLLQTRAILDKPQEILIYPRTVDISYFGINFNTSSVGGSKSWLKKGSGESIFGIREYIPGDSLSHIYWRSTAHTGKLIVKDFDSDRAKKVWVILDLNQSVQAGSGIESTEEYAITLAASMLKKYSDSMCQIGLITRTDDFHIFQPKAGEANLWRLLEALAIFKPSGDLPFNHVIGRAHGYLDGNSLAIIITPYVDADIIKSVAFVHRRSIPVAFILLDSLSFGGNPLNPDDLTLLKLQAFPSYIVRKGDNISTTLDKQSKILYNQAREAVYK